MGESLANKRITLWAEVVCQRLLELERRVTMLEHTTPRPEVEKR